MHREMTQTETPALSHCDSAPSGRGTSCAAPPAHILLSSHEMTMLSDFTSYHWIVLNSSVGKDSQAMIDVVAERCDQVGVPRGRLVVAHADLGRVEWPGTRELAEEQARHYGLASVAVSRPQGDLLDHIARRGMFPSPAAR